MHTLEHQWTNHTYPILPRNKIIHSLTARHAMARGKATPRHREWVRVRRHPAAGDRTRLPLDGLEGRHEHLYDLPFLQLYHLQGRFLVQIFYCVVFCVHIWILYSCVYGYYCVVIHYFSLCYCMYIYIMFIIVCFWLYLLILKKYITCFILIWCCW